MIVCLCEGLNDKQLRATIRDGASSVREIRKACGAGGTCGSCVCDLKDLLADERPEAQKRPRRLLSK